MEVTTRSGSSESYAPLLPQQVALLASLAQRYGWWKTPAEAMQQPARVIAQVMSLGDYDDTQQMVAALGEDGLRAVLALAEAGQFDARSWAYWHYRLGLADAETRAVPELPQRRVA